MSASPRPSISFEVPGIPPGPNERLHWRELAALRKSFTDSTYLVAKDAVYQARWIAPAKSRLSFVYVYRVNRQRDPDNLIGGVKPIIDGLVLAGVIPNDSLTEIDEIKVTAKIDPKGRPGVIVHVYAE